jgi:hypothetical protein
MRTYTQHKLTDAQLRRLSALVNETKGAATAGMAGQALIRKGLAVDSGRYAQYPVGVTDEGRAALQQARREGW